ncbi:hypothetical protein AA23498_3167 [Acetobacter nitrogenifigens DSM 23921 = NBRC 105050]|nr:hypothetical protein AA23498_3167 [Acetobacter nitrogenifigens DSM 23921 = NBRC 105050]
MKNHDLAPGENGSRITQINQNAAPRDARQFRLFPYLTAQLPNAFDGKPAG